MQVELAMSQTGSAFVPDLEQCRPYLRLLARLQMGSRLQGKLDPSDIVQQSLLEAHEKQAQFRGGTEGEWLAWLRGILAHNLADAGRAFRQARRDISREQSLESQLRDSSLRLGECLVAPDTSPSNVALGHERAALIARALATLPDARREALLLRYWEGWPLAQIAQHMGRTHAAVASLLKHGLRQLRELLQEPDDL
ncbi:MAG TPA: sigma-70 family RNA polymerase sigma factor [Gemmataceae bacterium]|nr:sigma-70 family RNA polymerase sigma factor [Gemmataceae bacterium]